MRFEHFDLNLLVALNALIERRSVTFAASDVGLGQSAMSGALNRLRVYFDDPLLVPVGRTMQLTPKAQELAGPVKESLLHIRSNIMTPRAFDPATSTRSFTIVTSDYAYSILLNKVLVRLAELAPALKFSVVSPFDETFEAFSRGEIDVSFVVEALSLPGFPRHTLFDDEHVLIYSMCNDRIKKRRKRLDMETFCNLDHVIVSCGPHGQPAVAEVEYEKRRVQRNIVMSVPTFAALADAVAGTRKVATIQRRLAQKLAETHPIAITKLPVNLPRLKEVIQWHPMHGRNEGTQWLVAQVVKMAGPP